MLDGNIAEEDIKKSKERLTMCLFDIDPNTHISGVLSELVMARSMLATYPLVKSTYNDLPPLVESTAIPDGMKIDEEAHLKVLSRVHGTKNRSLREDIELYREAENAITTSLSGREHFVSHMNYHRLDSKMEAIETLINREGFYSKDGKLGHLDIKMSLDPRNTEQMEGLCRKMTEQFNSLEAATLETNALALKLRSCMDNEIAIHEKYQLSMGTFALAVEGLISDYKIPESSGSMASNLESLCGLVRDRIDNEKIISMKTDEWLLKKFKAGSDEMHWISKLIESGSIQCCKKMPIHFVNHHLTKNYPSKLVNEDGHNTNAFHLVTRFIDALNIQRKNVVQYPAKPWTNKEDIGTDFQTTRVEMDETAVKVCGRCQTEVWEGAFLAYGSWKIKTDDFLCQLGQVPTCDLTTNRSGTELYLGSGTEQFHAFLCINEVIETMKTKEQKEALCIKMPRYAYYSPVGFGFAYDPSFEDLKTLSQWKLDKKTIGLGESLGIFKDFLQTIKDLGSIGWKLNVDECESISMTDKSIKLVINDWHKAITTLFDTSDVYMIQQEIASLRILLLRLVESEVNYVNGFPKLDALLTKLNTCEHYSISKFIEKITEIIESIPHEVTLLYTNIQALMEGETGFAENCAISGGRKQIPNRNAKDDIQKICKDIAGLSKNKPQHVFFINHHKESVYYLAFNRK